MKLRSHSFLRKAYLCGLVAAFLVLPQLAAGQKVINALSPEDYGLLVETLFPRLTPKFEVLEHEYAVDVRMSPSFSPPRQVSFVKLRTGKFETISYTLADQDRSLGDRLTTILEKEGRRDVPFIAQQIEVKKGKPASDTLMRSLDEVLKCIRIDKEDSITLDGVSFELWYKDSANEFYISLLGGESYEKGEPQLITTLRRMATAR